jgi:RNA polymerase sigma factor (sigma-70 family)
VVHDIFFALWQRRTSIDPETALAPYLFTAVRRRVIDVLRHAQVEERLERSLTKIDARTWIVDPPDTGHVNRRVLDSAKEETAIPALGEPPLTPDEAASLSELTTALDQLFAQLSERNRALMTLRWIHGMTYEQIADALGTSLDATKKQGRRLQQLLTPLLEHFRR